MRDAAEIYVLYANHGLVVVAAITTTVAATTTTVEVAASATIAVIAATAATTAAVATATAAATETTAAAAATEATATTAVAGTSFIDFQSAAFEIGLIQGFNGRSGFIIIIHFDKTKALGLTSFVIRNDFHRMDRTESREGFLQLPFRYLEGNVTNINVHQRKLKKYNSLKVKVFCRNPFRFRKKSE